MSKWPGKTVIGLTGNIGTGKSVVRRMLEHLGAFGIDADALSHRAIAKGAPGYSQVVTQFGRWILNADGEIDRQRLGKLVFSDPYALKILEDIVHPLVSQAVDFLVSRTKKTVIFIEAIKLLESDLKDRSDSIWVVYVPEKIQIERLVTRRKMDEAEAIQRIRSQSPQVIKMGAANVVINNDGSVEGTWKQVLRHWQKIVPTTIQTVEAPVARVQTITGELSVTRGNPRNSEEIAAVINRLRPNGHRYTRNDIMEAFGEKAFLLLRAGEKSVGILGWQVENLVSRTTDMLMEQGLQFEKAIPLMIDEMENASRELQCEVSLVFLYPSLASNEKIWERLGYEKRTPETLGVRAWMEAARDSKPGDTQLFFKKLRVDRILRPI
ncbi:MAG: dephospho-CoA kinase [Anaerolineaceae bacterium]